MKKIIIPVVFFSLIVFGFILSKLFYLPDSNTVKSESKEPQVLIVQEFWAGALKGAEIDQLLTSPPKEFFDSTPRCVSGNKAKSDQDAGMTLDARNENGFVRGLRQTADLIEKGQYTLLTVKNYRHWEKEAIVEAEFAKTSDHNFREKRYFLLILADGKWKIFMDTDVPNLINKEYARYDCSQQ